MMNKDFIRNVHFMNMCDHILNYEVDQGPNARESLYNFLSDIEKIKENDLVFCRVDYIQHAIFKRVLEKLEHPINLIIHKGDYIINHRYLDDLKINNIFCTNLNAKLHFNNTKLFPIPWGFGENEPTTEELNKVVENRIEFKDKKDKLYYPYHAAEYCGHSARTSFMKEIEQNQFICDNPEFKLDYDTHIENINKSKFCIVLPGASWANDPGRTWECLIRHTVPIMKRTFSHWWESGLEIMAKTHNIPILFVDEWTDINENIFDLEFDFSNVDVIMKQKYWVDFIKQRVIK